MTTTATPAPTKAELIAKAKALIAARSTLSLLECFEATNGMNGEGVSTTRGWLMDELETRNPAAFERWLEATPATDSPRAFFGL